MAGTEPGIPASLRQQEATLTQPGLPDLNSHHPTGDRRPGAMQNRARWRQLRQHSLPAAPRSLASPLPNTLLGIILCVLAKLIFCATKCNNLTDNYELTNGFFDLEEAKRKREREGTERLQGNRNRNWFWKRSQILFFFQNNPKNYKIIFERVQNQCLSWFNLPNIVSLVQNHTCNLYCTVTSISVIFLH